MSAVEKTLSFEFWLTTMVCHRPSPNSGVGMVTSVSITPQGVIYGVTWAPNHESRHFGCELRVASDMEINELADGWTIDDSDEDEDEDDDGDERATI